MGFFTKMKDILFEEEDVTEEIKLPKKEKQKEKIKEPEEQISHQVVPEKKEEPKKEESKEENNFDTISERELFKSDNTFPFPDFDEEEFSNSISRPKTRSTNVLEYERKKRTETRTDYGRYEKTEIKETTEKKKFKPSPIISPVYGILNEDYRIEDIKDKNDDTKIDIDSVRKKAFEEPIEMITDEPKKTYYEETVTVKVKEPEEEKKEKVKTIDELLEDNSDVVLKDNKKTASAGKIKYDEIDKDLEEVTKPESKKEELNENEDTLENDLFDLIDSMYDSGEDGEK